MNRQTYRLMRRKNSGLTLVEMMIALIVGLLVVLAASQVVIATRAGYRTQDDAGRILENGQFAIDLIHRHVRLAGYMSSVTTTAQTPLLPYDTNGFGNSAPLACAQDPNQFICGWNDVGTLSSDVLSIRLRGFSDALDAAADNSMVDCAGVAIARGETIEERFMVVENATTGNRDLVCFVIRGAAAIQAAPFPGAPNNNPIVIAEGVRGMQILYGSANQRPGQAVGAGVLFPVQWRIPNGANPTNLNSTISVKIAILLEGINIGSATEEDTNTYQYFGADYANAADAGASYTASGDRVLRKLYSTTIALRNRLR